MIHKETVNADNAAADKFSISCAKSKEEGEYLQGNSCDKTNLAENALQDTYHKRRKTFPGQCMIG